jgi:hypothetical protein
MKKPKRSDEWEEPSADSSKEIEAVLDNLGDLDDLDDEIIDLDDVIEPFSEGHEDDDEFASDADILDAKGSLGLRGFEDKAESDDDFLLEDDLLKELSFFQDEKAEAETDRTADSMEEELEELGPGFFGDSDEEAVEGSESQTEALVLDERELEAFVFPVAAPVAEEPELEFFASPVAESLVEEPGPELSVTPVEGPVPDEAQPEVFVLPVAAPVIEEPEVSAPPVAASPEASVSLEDFVARIENQLVDAIREIVEARLPEIVRTVLREEIEKLKSDQEPED